MVSNENKLPEDMDLSLQNPSQTKTTILFIFLGIY